MTYYNQWHLYLQQLQQQMEKQQQVIDKLETQLKEMAAIEHPKTVIEKIEYHFDQLKIETLEGTLQIGLTPNGSDLGDLYNQNPPTTPLLHSLNEYMTTDIPPWMNRYVTEHDIRVSEDQKETIIEDVKKQLPARIDFYKEQHADWKEEAVLHQIQSEIRDSLAHYFKHMEGEG